MKIRWIIVFLLFPWGASYADALLFMGYNNGKNYTQLFSDDQRSTYAQGFINGITLHNLFNDRQDVYNAFMRCTQRMTAGQVGEVIKRYIIDHPNQQNMNLNVLSIYALNETCSDKVK